MTIASYSTNMIFLANFLNDALLIFCASASLFISVNFQAKAQWVKIKNLVFIIFTVVSYSSAIFSIYFAPSLLLTCSTVQLLSAFGSWPPETTATCLLNL
jgi:hypothetical protein